MECHLTLWPWKTCYAHQRPNSKPSRRNFVLSFMTTSTVSLVEQCVPRTQRPPLSFSFIAEHLLDKIWADWQSRSTAHKNAYFLNINGNVQKTIYAPDQLIDLNRQPVGVSVVYQDTRVSTNVKRFLASKIIKQYIFTHFS